MDRNGRGDGPATARVVGELAAINGDDAAAGACAQRIGPAYADGPIVENQFAIEPRAATAERKGPGAVLHELAPGAGAEDRRVALAIWSINRQRRCAAGEGASGAGDGLHRLIVSVQNQLAPGSRQGDDHRVWNHPDGVAGGSLARGDSQCAAAAAGGAR